MNRLAAMDLMIEKSYKFINTSPENNNPGNHFEWIDGVFYIINDKGKSFLKWEIFIDAYPDDGWELYEPEGK